MSVTCTVRVRTVNNIFRAYFDRACARSITPCFKQTRNMRQSYTGSHSMDGKCSDFILLARLNQELIFSIYISVFNAEMFNDLHHVYKQNKVNKPPLHRIVNKKQFEEQSRDGSMYRNDRDISAIPTLTFCQRFMGLRCVYDNKIEKIDYPSARGIGDV